ncbi:MAG: hypothetical protein PHP69_04790 [Candidatus Omnitrophica bacterium]|jgi:hypothetical protein|nr:hypothetical protein [Candidatus Omnitrophota bacterium]MDD5080404.1 hypothetical protein [Candidatus Omnitrophota bacterium]MDD5440710.1 hypothetical protein [Candidatus Omnitrophota bacterium]
MYSKPRIAVIELDPGQAVLQTCSVGGIYFNIAVGSFCMKTTAPVEPALTNFFCIESVRTLSGATTTSRAQNEAMPS